MARGGRAGEGRAGPGSERWGSGGRGRGGAPGGGRSRKWGAGLWRPGSGEGVRAPRAGRSGLPGRGGFGASGVRGAVERDSEGKALEPGAVSDSWCPGVGVRDRALSKVGLAEPWRVLGPGPRSGPGLVVQGRGGWNLHPRPRWGPASEDPSGSGASREPRALRAGFQSHAGDLAGSGGPGCAAPATKKAPPSACPSSPTRRVAPVEPPPPPGAESVLIPCLGRGARRRPPKRLSASGCHGNETPRVFRLYLL